jgi:uncharacterized membrane protein
MYYHVHYPAILHGMQYLSMCSHLSPDSIAFILPFFYIFQSPLTLLIVQATIVGLTAFAVFLVSSDLLGDQRTGFILFLAFLLNPGVIALLVFDFHLEVMIPLFALFAFYMFAKKRKRLFVISGILLAFSTEAAPTVAIALGLGLAFYASHLALEKNADREYLAMALALVLIGILAWIGYGWATSYLSRAYASGAYPGLPALLKNINFESGEISNFLARFHSTYIGVYYMPIPTTLFALAIILMSFGAIAMSELFILLLLTSPWLIEVLIFQNSNFVNLFNQYFAFGIGGTLIAAIMSINILRRKYGTHKSGRREGLGRFAAAHTNILILISAISLFAVYILLILYANPEGLKSLLLLRENNSVSIYSQQLDSIVARIPQNASIIVPYFVMAHVATREYLEIIPGPGQAQGILPSNAIVNTWSEYDTWFVPEYIIDAPNPHAAIIPLYGFMFGTAVNLTELSTYNGSYRISAKVSNVTMLSRDG